MVSESRISYLSMEIALHPAMPTYSGGLGMLAGDMLRAAADRELPMVAVTLLRPLPGAIITVRPARGGEEIAHQHADQNGRFEIALEPARTWSCRCRLERMHPCRAARRKRSMSP